MRTINEFMARVRLALAVALSNIKAVWATNASLPAKLFWTVRSGAVIIAAVVALGVLTIVIPIVYLISVSVGNTLPAGGLSAGQSSTLQTLVANGGSALVLTTTAETVGNDLKSDGSGNHPACCLPVHGLQLVAGLGRDAVQKPIGSLTVRIGSTRPSWSCGFGPMGRP